MSDKDYTPNEDPMPPEIRSVPLAAEAWREGRRTGFIEGHAAASLGKRIERCQEAQRESLLEQAQRAMEAARKERPQLSMNEAMVLSAAVRGVFAANNVPQGHLRPEAYAELGRGAGIAAAAALVQWGEGPAKVKP